MFLIDCSSSIRYSRAAIRCSRQLDELEESEMSRVKYTVTFKTLVAIFIRFSSSPESYQLHFVTHLRDITYFHSTHTTQSPIPLRSSHLPAKSTCAQRIHKTYKPQTTKHPLKRKSQHSSTPDVMMMFQTHPTCLPYTRIQKHRTKTHRLAGQALDRY